MKLGWHIFAMSKQDFIDYILGFLLSNEKGLQKMLMTENVLKVAYL